MALVNELEAEFTGTRRLSKDGLASIGVSGPFIEDNASG